MNKKQLKTIIITCWALLGICFIIKLFGGNWFELSTENQKFINFCNMVDNTMWLKMILACVISVITSYPVYCIIYNKERFNKKHNIILILFILFRSILSWNVVWIVYVLDLLMLIILPIILTRKWKRVILTNVVVFAFQLVSLIIRGAGFINFNTQNYFVIQTLFQIDYIIMLVLLYLYNKKYFIKKEV